MMRLFSIFLLYTQHAFEYKGRSFVWFLTTLFDASLYLLFWRGALLWGGADVSWTIPEVVSYYLLLIIAGCFLHCHIEEEVAVEDIQMGGLSNFLLRPLSYFWFKFCQELPWRIIQGTFGLFVLAGVTLLYRLDFAPLAHAPLIAVIILLAYMLNFMYKMIIGLSAFWFTDYSGFHNLEYVVFLLVGGFIIPLHMLPEIIRSAAMFQPIAYMIYYPIIAVQGKLSVPALMETIGMQVVWLIVIAMCYRYLWTKGLKRFSAVGR